MDMLIKIFEINRYSIKPHDKVIISFHISGCSGCNQKVLEIMNSELTEDILFIVSYQSDKDLNLSIPFELRNKVRLIHDKDMLAYPKNSVHPYICFYANGSIRESYHMNVENANELIERIRTWILSDKNLIL
ncbi:MAG TPA: hypothetical protein PKC24_10655 [Cyclobacteriaceae bacterium]|nr:hypothetical protein [Cyclobacteriaceae bacterium]